MHPSGDQLKIKTQSREEKHRITHSGWSLEMNATSRKTTKNRLKASGPKETEVKGGPYKGC